MRTVQNNSANAKLLSFYCETENSERQLKDQHGHVVISAICRKRNSKSL